MGSRVKLLVFAFCYLSPNKSVSDWLIGLSTDVHEMHVSCDFHGIAFEKNKPFNISSIFPTHKPRFSVSMFSGVSCRSIQLLLLTLAFSNTAKWHLDDNRTNQRPNCLQTNGFVCVLKMVFGSTPAWNWCGVDRLPCSAHFKNAQFRINHFI